MKLVTSISPNNIDRQQKAIDTWNFHELFSINHASEIEQLQNLFPAVTFIEAKNTGLNIFGKHYIPIPEFRDFVLRNGPALIINSDILINGELKTSETDLVIYNRYECKGYDFNNNHKFISGYDAFYLTPTLARLIPDSSLCMGQCHWDYLIPYVLSQKGIMLVTPSDAILFHESHPIQYTNHDWERTCKIFAKEVGLTGHPNKASHKAYQYILSKTSIV